MKQNYLFSLFYIQVNTYKNMMQKLKTRTKILLLLFLIVSLACNKRVNNEITPAERITIPKFGTNSTFEIATWNIQQFPKLNNQTIRDVAEIIRDLDIDLYAVQEITNSNAFSTLMDSLTEYDGIVATNTGSFALWTGMIYKKSMISISNQEVLFANDPNFPRLPYSVYIQASHNKKSFDFTLIVLHLKAQGDAASVQKRKVAIQTLEQYVSDELQQVGDSDFIIAGDWNDELEDAPAQNVFNPFLNKPQQYVFLTLPFVGSQTEYTYIGGSFESLIDHIMVTASIDTAYTIETQIIKADQFFNQYLSEISDHRPVAARINAF